MVYVITCDNDYVVKIKKNKVWTCDSSIVAKKFRSYEKAVMYMKDAPEKERFQIRGKIKNENQDKTN